MVYSGEPDLKIALISGTEANFNMKMEQWHSEHPNAKIYETVFSTSDRASDKHNPHYGVFIAYKD